MRIATWNMQGGTNTPFINQVVQSTQANILCLQECGDLAQHLQNRQPILNPNGAIIGYTGNFVVGQGFMECVYWENVWIQGGLAVLTNVGMTNFGILNAVVVPGFQPNNPRNLPWMTVRHPNTGINITIFSIHSPPVFDGTTIVDVCNWNNAQITQINNGWGAGSWACVGDFNADPTVAGFLQPPVGVVVRGNQATQQGGGIL
ncbi:MAG: hypothetical protein F6K62_22610, partial [Sphaerospermopsis sp. SIO1G2]|nr:hypothetical protein [Sphaerospermopsis sp. SIO1G2]